MRKNDIIVKLRLVVIGILFFQCSFSQENFLPGYIVTLKGDSTHGFIDYRNWERNPGKITFQGKINGEKINYTPIDIKLFSVLDEIYVSAIVETEVSPVKTSMLRFNPELQIETDTTFLQTMIKGIISLYYYKDSYGKENFYIKQNEEFDLLTYKKYLKIYDGPPVVLENKKYIGQLTVYLQDCPSIQSKLRNISYNKNSLEKLFIFYYDCTKSVIDFQKKTEKAIIEIGILAGISVSSLKFKGKDFPHLENAEYSNSLNFTGGLFLDIVLPRDQRKWSIYNEFIYTSYKVDGNYVDIKNSYKHTIVYSEFDYSYLKMNNMLRYKFPIGTLFAFFNAGFSNGFVINGTNNRTIESRFNSIIKVVEDKSLNETRIFEIGYILGLGTKYKKFSFEVRYEKGTGMAYNLKSISTRYYCLLGYKI